MSYNSIVLSIKKNILLTVIAILLILAVLAVAGYSIFKNLQGSSSKKVAEKAMLYINQEILGKANAASLVSVSEVAGVIKMDIKIGDQQYSSYVTKDGKILFPEGYEMADEIQEVSSVLGNFIDTGEEVCKEDGKPIIYFFGSNSCPHCLWEHPIFGEVVAKFKDFISFHDNMDSSADSKVFSEYSSQGAIPTLVLGCKYARTGSGESVGESEEAKNLTALFCKLTDNQPSDVCSSVQELINQIK
jgi:thiol-disulfide isomerase/thioredoxin